MSSKQKTKNKKKTGPTARAVRPVLYVIEGLISLEFYVFGIKLHIVADYRFLV